MKGSENNFKGNFESAWRKQLENAEFTPDSKVWEGIDSQLGKSELLKYKFYLKVYRGIAAFAVLFACFVTAYSYLNYSDKSPTQATRITANSFQQNYIVPYRLEGLASLGLGYVQDPNSLFKGQHSQAPYLLSESKNYNKVSEGILAATENTNDALTSAQKEKGGKQMASLNGGRTLNPDNTRLSYKKAGPSLKNQGSLSAGIASDDSVSTNIRSEITLSETNTDTDFSTNLGESTSRFSAEENTASTAKNAAVSYPNIIKNALAPIVLKEIAASSNIEDALKKSGRSAKMARRETPASLAYEIKSAPRKQLYANLSLNSEFFDPNFSSLRQVPMPYSNMNNINPELAQNMGVQNSPEVSVMYGLNVGLKISDNWLFEGGVSYANYNTATETNVSLTDINGGAAAPLTIQGRPVGERNNSSMLNFSDRYELNNTFEFASVPLRAGYIIPINKFNLIFKAGVTTEFFISNEVSEPNSMLNTVRHTPGESSPFKRMYFNGTVGNEINYELNKSYSFSLETNYRVALNSFTKASESFESNPSAYGIGMVVRYHFSAY